MLHGCRQLISLLMQGCTYNTPVFQHGFFPNAATLGCNGFTSVCSCRLLPNCWQSVGMLLHVLKTVTDAISRGKQPLWLLGVITWCMGYVSVDFALDNISSHCAAQAPYYYTLWDWKTMAWSPDSTVILGKPSQQEFIKKRVLNGSTVCINGIFQDKASWTFNE